MAKNFRSAVNIPTGSVGPFTVSSSALSSSSGIFSASTVTITGNLTASAGTTTLGTTNVRAFTATTGLFYSNLTATAGTSTFGVSTATQLSVLNNSNAELLKIESSSVISRDLYTYNTGALLKINSTTDSNTEAGEIEFIKYPISGGYLEVNEQIGSIKFNSQYATSVDYDAIGPSSYIKSTVKSLPSFQAPNAELEIYSASVKIVGNGTYGGLIIGSTIISSLTGAATLASAVITGNLTASTGTTTLGTASVLSTSSATVPLIIKGAASQSANLQEWKNSSASVLASISASGGLNVSSGSISGSVIATQSWVTAQGYGSGGGSSSSITASAGTVGNWNISSSSLYNQGSASSYVGMISASTASYAFFAGGQSNSGSAAQFYVTPAGTLTSNSASISGVVTFTSGTLGPFTVSSSALSSSSGAITASNGTITGNLTASAGTATLGTTNTGSFTATAASVGSNRVTTNDIIRGYNHTPVGSIDTANRIYFTGTATPLGASAAYYTFFTATDTINASSISLYSTNAVATTAWRYGLYTVSNSDLASASLTLVARSASTSITTTAGGLTTKAFDTTGGFPASYTLTAGTRYAIGIYTVGATTVAIVQNQIVAYNTTTTPRLAVSQTAQSDLSSAFSASALGGYVGYTWYRISGTLV